MVADMEKKGFVADMMQNHPNTCGNDPDLRLKSSAFTRNRELPAKWVLVTLLRWLAGSLQLEMDNLLEHFEENQ